jgi:hypothetical protein
MNGERVGNIRFAYRLATDSKHIESAPAEQVVLQAIRALRQSGQTIRGIADWLWWRALRSSATSAARSYPVEHEPASTLFHGVFRA